LLETTRGIPTKNSFENSRKSLNRQQKFEVPRRNPQSNSPQHSVCGIYNGNQSSQIEVTKSSADESFCLKRSRISALQSTSLPNITHERLTERRHCQHIGQCLVSKMTSIKHTKFVRRKKQFCCHQCGKSFMQNAYFTKHMKNHLEKNPHCC